MKARTFALLMAIAALLPAQRTQAQNDYLLYPWQGSCFTHNSPMVAEALRQWGEGTMVRDCGQMPPPGLDPSVPRGDIEVFYAAATTGAGWATQVIDETGKWAFACYISINPLYADSQAVITHEVGHCLGLDHSLSSADLMFWFVGNALRPTANDLAAMRALYPVRTRTVMPMIGADR